MSISWRKINQIHTLRAHLHESVVHLDVTSHFPWPSPFPSTPYTSLLTLPLHTLHLPPHSSPPHLTPSSSLFPSTPHTSLISPPHLTLPHHTSHTEVERNLAADNVLTLNHWVLFNELFPLSYLSPSLPSSPSRQLTQSESMMYRCEGVCERVRVRECMWVYVRVSYVAEECLWMVHLTCPPNRTVGTLLSVSTFIYKRVPMFVIALTYRRLTSPTLHLTAVVCCYTRPWRSMLA